MYLTELQGQLVTFLPSHKKAKKEKILNYYWTSENTWSCWRHRESLVSSIWFLHRWNTRHALSPKCDQRSKIHELKWGGMSFDFWISNKKVCFYLCNDLCVLTSVQFDTRLIWRYFQKPTGEALLNTSVKPFIIPQVWLFSAIFKLQNKLMAITKILFMRGHTCFFACLLRYSWL